MVKAELVEASPGKLVIQAGMLCWWTPRVVAGAYGRGRSSSKQLNRIFAADVRLVVGGDERYRAYLGPIMHESCRSSF